MSRHLSFLLKGKHFNSEVNRFNPDCCEVLVRLQEVKPRFTLSQRETTRTHVETFDLNVKPFDDVAPVWTAPGRPSSGGRSLLGLTAAVSSLWQVMAPPLSV